MARPKVPQPIKAIHTTATQRIIRVGMRRATLALLLNSRIAAIIPINRKIARERRKAEAANMGLKTAQLRKIAYYQARAVVS